MERPSWMKEPPSGEQSKWSREREPSSGAAALSADARRYIKEAAKQLEIVYEDEGHEFGAYPTDMDTLLARHKVATKLRKSRIQEVFRNIRRARNVELCFLVDCTGSMSPHIDGVRKSIDNILKQLTDDGRHVTFANTRREAQSMTVAFVAYRNLGYSKQFEVLPFTSADEFKRFSHGLDAEGGNGVEDVFGGLEKALDLPWSMDCGTKVIFHIGDTPCHGKEFHSVGYDSHPGGDPKGRTPKVIFTKMRAQGIQYHFGKITKDTDIMVQKFSEAYGEPITEFDVKNVNNIGQSVITAVRMSIAANVSSSKRSVGVPRKERAFTLIKTEPDWSTLPELDGIFVSYKFPRSIQDIRDNVPLERNQPKRAIVKIAKNPFGKGAERIAYYGKDLSNYTSSESNERKKWNRDIVLKEHLYTGAGMDSNTRFELSNQMQTIADFLTQMFVKDLAERAGMKRTILFIKIKTLCITNGSKDRYMSCEKRLSADSEFVRFTNNADYHIMDARAVELGVDIELVHLVTAFSHWTYKASNRFLMVVDLEGVVGKIDGEIGVLLTDPAIHCMEDTRYGPMNHGHGGMKTFFEIHVCNKFCKALGLEGFEC